MTALAEINSKAHSLLLRELGAADYARFLQQFSTGRGDYTAERQDCAQEESATLQEELMKHKAVNGIKVPPRAKQVIKS